MTNWSRIAKHLIKHGYLQSDHQAAPLSLLLLHNFQHVWLSEWQRLLRVPLLPMVPPAAALDTHTSRDNDMSHHLDEVCRNLSLTAPLAVSLTTLHCHWNQPILSPSELSSSFSITSDSKDDAPQTRSSGGRESAGGAERSSSESPVAGHWSGDCTCDSAPPPPVSHFSVCARVPRAVQDKWFRVLQRRRRIWWRQLLRDPGDIGSVQMTNNNSSQQCDGGGACETLNGGSIVFRGELCVERLYVREEATPTTSSGQTRNQTSLVFSHISRDSSLWALTADAIGEGASNAAPAPLHVSSRLAPFTHAVIASGAQTTTLHMLACHICNKWRELGVSVYPGPCVRRAPSSLSRAHHMIDPPTALGHMIVTDPTPGQSGPSSQPDLPSEGRDTDEARDNSKDGVWLEAVLSRLDAVGVSVVVLLDDQSLHCGQCHVRYRDTTLLHASHVTDVVRLSCVNMGRQASEDTLVSGEEKD